MNTNQTEALKAQLARHDVGLAMYDETYEQAQQTAKARQDDTYLARWMAFTAEAEMAAWKGILQPKTVVQHDGPYTYEWPASVPEYKGA